MRMQVNTGNLPALIVISAFILVGVAPTVSAQAPANTTLKDLLDRVRATEPATLEQQVRLCEIPAPSFKEGERAKAYLELLQSIGLEKTRIDAEGNVLGELGGRSKDPTVVLSAHLDTVYPEGTDVTVQREGVLLKGPGIVDDCRGLAVVFGVARVLREMKVQPAGRIIFVATVGEEGAGNLRGVKHLFDKELKDQIDYFISVDGAGNDLTYRAVGSARYRVTYHGPGGHSYGAFGLPSAIHALGRAISKLSDLQVPSDPKTTFTVGIIGGGTSVNSIAHTASMDVDMRSVEPKALEELVAKFQQAVDQAAKDENQRWNSNKIKVDVETIGLRPAASQQLTDPIVVAGIETAESVGIEAQPGAGSTDSNYPMNLGIPAVTIDGGGKGSGAHSPELEIFDTRESYKGTQWALALLLRLAGM